MQTSHRPAQVVFYFSDTGGGHRSAAEAIIEAMEHEYSGQFSAELVDFFKNIGRGPIRKMPELYPEMVKAKSLYQASFYATDGRAQARFVTATLWPLMRSTVRKMVDAHPADLVVSVHPLATTATLKALGGRRPPYYTVVTDLVTTHALWFDTRADRILLPTEVARQRALSYHMPPEKLEVVGLPVAERYCRPVGNKRAARPALGWPADLPMILIVGGSEGMGPLAQTARAIDESGLRLGMAIVCGRNAKLQAELQSHTWENPTFVYGFTTNMPELMRAADVIVTKAGPGTIAEALNANLPVILYSKIAGQEDGNVAYVESEGAGVWAPKPQLVVRALARWLTRPEEHRGAIEAARRAARPEAAKQIARMLVDRLRRRETSSERVMVRT